jgi:4,5-DOPA dioxygenase extradiol
VSNVIDRRSALELLLAGALAPALAACQSGTPPAQKQTTKGSTASMPAIFLAHGSPMLLDDAQWVAELAAWAKALPRPRAVLMISAHWVNRPITLGATRTVPLVYDFYGFARRYYEVTYAAPGAPELARRIRELLAGPETIAEAPRRGLDHGAYVPLLAMYPQADVPVLQISIPTLEPAPLIRLGQALAPLRREGVLLLGSGFLTHNLRALDMTPNAPAPSWASEFDAWCREAISGRDVDALATYRERAPGVERALPTHEHFVPVLVTFGASLAHSEPVSFPITGFAYGSATKRSVQFG